MKVLFLHGKESSPNSQKVKFMRELGHDVYAPVLEADNWEQSVTAARNAISHVGPDVVIGSSRGGAVAMATHTLVKTVLIAPAWKKYAPWLMTRANSVIIHSPQDDIVAYEDSLELAHSSGCHLVSAGECHRMIDSDALLALATCLSRSDLDKYFAKTP